MGALTRHPHRLRDMRDGHPLTTDTINEQTATMHRQSSVTVRHEDLRMLWRPLITTASEVFPFDQWTVTNVLAKYS